jgi:hypothetical protein
VVQANGIEDHSFVKEMDYQEVLNSQEIFGDELAMFAKKELQKEVGRISYWFSESVGSAVTFWASRIRYNMQCCGSRITLCGSRITLCGSRITLMRIRTLIFI